MYHKSKDRIVDLSIGNTDSYNIYIGNYLEMSKIELPKKLNDARLQRDTMDAHKAIIFLVALFASCSSIMFFAYRNFPQLDENDLQYIKVPRTIEDAKNLGGMLQRYKDQYFLPVMCGFTCTYIFLQTFAIPGSIFLSIISGFLFRLELALCLVCFCSATGASLCYLLSYVGGRPIILKYFHEKFQKWQLEVQRQSDTILYYIIFLRITPFIPNWFINLASPILNIPLWPFWFGTFVGVAPPSFLAVQAGQMLYQMTSSSDMWSWKSIVVLVIASTFALVPILLKNRLRRKFE